MHHELVNIPIVDVKQSLCAHLLQMSFIESLPQCTLVVQGPGSMSKGYRATAVAFVIHRGFFREYSSLARGLWHSLAGKGSKGDSHQMHLKGKLKI